MSSQGIRSQACCRRAKAGAEGAGSSSLRRAAFLSATVAVVALLLVLPCWPGPLSALARTVGDSYWTGVFAEIARQYVAVPGLDLEVWDVRASPPEVEVPGGRLGYRLLSPARGLAPGRRSVSLMLTVDGRDAKPVRLAGTIGLFREVVCVERRLGRGTVIGAGDLVLARKNVALLGDNPVVSMAAAVGRRLTTSRPAGAVLYETMLEEPPLVQRNDRVTIVASSGRVRVSAPGLVRAPGRRGEMVPVKNLVSRKVVHARVRDAHTVEVDL